MKEDEGGRATLPEEGAGRRGVLRGLTKGWEKKIEGGPEKARREDTAGRSLKRKEVALRYRLQMVAFTRAVAGETEGARTVEWIRGFAATANVMLSQEEGHVGRVVTGYARISDGVVKSRAPGCCRQSPGKGYRPKSGRKATWGMNWRTGTTGVP